MVIIMSMVPLAFVSFIVMKRWSDGRKRTEQKLLIHHIRKLKRERTMLRSDIESNNQIMEKLNELKKEAPNISVAL